MNHLGVIIIHKHNELSEEDQREETYDKFIDERFKHARDDIDRISAVLTVSIDRFQFRLKKFYNRITNIFKRNHN